jgi:exopolysaccharide biosynthesis polyprenyl glycosylphosphotransferase
MQYDFKHRISALSQLSENLPRTEGEKLIIETERLSQVVAFVDQHESTYFPGKRDDPGGIAHHPKMSGQPNLHHSHKLSPATWSLALVMGDVVLLGILIILGLVFDPSSQLGILISGYALGTWNSKFAWICLTLVLWSIAVRLTKAQELSSALRPLESSLCALQALFPTFIFLAIPTYPFVTDKWAYTRELLIFLVVAALALSTWRAIFAEIIRLPRFRRQAVILGANPAGEAVARELCNTKRTSIDVLGYIRASTDEEPREEGIAVLGGRNVLYHLMQNSSVDTVIVAIDYHTSPELFQDAIKAAQIGISVLPMAMVYESTSGKIPVQHLRDQWYTTLAPTSPVSPLYTCWRKVMDIAFGLAGLVTLILVLPIVALLIYLESPGPIFYSQERLGYQGRKFYIHKFRSMSIDAEADGQAVWASQQDERVTSVGRFLRATHLDELPQALNILRGEMSLIGPRPERPEFVSELEQTIPFYLKRLSVKPGLTGWAQVQSGYTSTDQGALIKLQYDLYYIKHQSFTLDLAIILMTIIEVLFCRGI